MDFQLSEEHLAIQKMAEDFAAKEIAPVVDADEKAHRFPKTIIKKMAELGFFGCVIPEKYGGSNTGFVSHALIVEAIGKVSASLRIPFNTIAFGPAATLNNWGTEEQKMRYLPGLMKGESMACFAITEPNAGSDVGSIATTAKLDGDHYILNGTKTWATYASVADVLLVYVSTDRGAKARGLSAFFIDIHLPGITTRDIDKMGVHSAPTGEIVFEDCRVPKESLIGQAGDGFKICMSTLDNTRLTTGAGALGMAEACLSASVKYATEREQFGQKVGTFQMNQEKIADMVLGVEAARWITASSSWPRRQSWRLF
ncbi:MAG: acyl-CoA dehydrogenase family protein [Deltaproteobacteria bacterium]|nr:acyl-CoA dehydrogenase family protein [Deltaproteobacteria bacterium]